MWHIDRKQTWLIPGSTCRRCSPTLHVDPSHRASPQLNPNKERVIQTDVWSGGKREEAGNVIIIKAGVSEVATAQRADRSRRGCEGSWISPEKKKEQIKIGLRMRLFMMTYLSNLYNLL